MIKQFHDRVRDGTSYHGVHYDVDGSQADYNLVDISAGQIFLNC